MWIALIGNSNTAVRVDITLVGNGRSSELTSGTSSCSGVAVIEMGASFDLPSKLAKETADEPVPFSYDPEGLAHLVHFALQPDQQNGSEAFELSLVFVFFFLACLSAS
jgi:hypothetical protein